MKKIVLLHYSAPPIVGGVESVLGHHARLMTDAGHQVRIVAGRGEQVDARIPFISIPLLDSRHEQVLTLKADLDAGRVPKEFDLLVERIASQLREATADADILIAHNVCSLNKNLALTAALRKLSETYRQPHLILWHHDLAWTTPRYRAELHAGYPWDLLRTAWPGVTQVVVSEMRQRELAELMGLPLEKIMVVPNGVDAASFLKLETQTLDFVKQLICSKQLRFCFCLFASRRAKISNWLCACWLCFGKRIRARHWLSPVRLDRTTRPTSNTLSG